jgi:hypothetical protein
VQRIANPKTAIVSLLPIMSPSLWGTLFPIWNTYKRRRRLSRCHKSNANEPGAGGKGDRFFCHETARQ